MSDAALDWFAAAQGGMLREFAAGNLGRFERLDLADTGLKPAAVVLLLAEGGAAGPAIYLTRRARGLRSHSGQWALPGGRLDPGEVAEEAALRELTEEVGLLMSASAIIGRLDDYPTRSGYRITPVVVWAGALPEFTLNPAEVDSIHEVSLADLDRPGAVEFVSIPESDRPVIRLHILENKIHAPTAAVVYQFREAVMHGRPTRVAELEQPVWAWR